MKPLVIPFLLCLVTYVPAGESVILDLEQAKKRALDNSHDLQLIAIKLTGARQSYDLGIRAFLPSLQVGLSSNEAVLIDAPDNASYRLNLTLSQPVYNGSRTVIQRSLEHTALLLENSGYAQKKEELLDSVFSQFYQIVILEAQKKLQQEMLAIAANQLTITEKEMAIGQIREIDLVETQLAVKNLAIQLKSMESGLEEVNFQFRQTLGLKLMDQVQVTGSIDKTYNGILLEEPVEYYYQLAMENNIQFRRNTFELKKSLEELRISEKNWLPSITAETTFSLGGPRLPLQDTAFSLKFNINFPLSLFPVSTSFTVGARPREYSRGAGSNVGILEDFSYPLTRKQARANLRMLQITADKTKENFRFQIGKTLVKYRLARESLNLARESLDLQKHKLEIQQKQLDLGEIKRLDLLQSQSDFFKAEIGLLQQILELIGLERSFETLLGLEAGTLHGGMPTP